MSTTDSPFADATRIIVDDADSSIQYSGPWQLESGRDIGTFGPSFNNTLHSVSVNGSFTFSFSGRQLVVLGTIDLAPPTWQCVIDETNVLQQFNTTGPENHWIFCQSGTLVDAPHVLRVEVQTTGQEFLLDSIEYVPSQKATLSNGIIKLDHRNAAFNYGDGWTEVSGVARVTQTNNAEVSINFVGNSITWIGIIPNDYPQIPANATYSLDEKPAVEFSIVPEENGPYLYNQVFFTVTDLIQGPHTLRVVHRGNIQQTPLTLENVIIQNGTVSNNSSTTTSITTTINTGPSLPTAPMPLPASKGKPVGAIVGGTVGGVSIIVVSLLIFLIFLKRKKRLEHEAEAFGIPSDFSEQMNSRGYSALRLEKGPLNLEIGITGVTTTSSALTASSTPAVGGLSSGPISTAAATNSSHITTGLTASEVASPFPQVILHEDSGIRELGSLGRKQRPVELPPMYTED